MSRPDYITNDDIVRWAENIDNDPLIPSQILMSDTIREVCYAGLWLAEQLDLLKCPTNLITRIQFTAGRYSFGRDPWEAHIAILNFYKENKLTFEENNINDIALN